MWFKKKKKVYPKMREQWLVRKTYKGASKHPHLIIIAYIGEGLIGYRTWDDSPFRHDANPTWSADITYALREHLHFVEKYVNPEQQPDDAENREEFVPHPNGD